MYLVTVKNGSGQTLTASDGTKIKPGGHWQTKTTSGWIDTEFAGQLSFLDIGEKHIPGDTSETWGSLILYRFESVVGRYEGEGALNISFDQFLCATLDGMDFRMVSLDPLRYAAH